MCFNFEGKEIGEKTITGFISIIRASTSYSRFVTLNAKLRNISELFP